MKVLGMQEYHYRTGKEFGKMKHHDGLVFTVLVYLFWGAGGYVLFFNVRLSPTLPSSPRMYFQVNSFSLTNVNLPNP